MINPHSVFLNSKKIKIMKGDKPTNPENVSYLEY